MKRLATVCVPVLIVLALLLSGALAQSGVGLDLVRWRASGGGASNGGNYRLGGTIGQHDAGHLRGGGFTLTGGFRGGLGNALPGHGDSYLPILRRSVATLTPTPTRTPTPTPTPMLANCNDQEPNNTPKTAKAAPPFGQMCKGSFLDEQPDDTYGWDLYAITLTAQQKISLSLTNIPAGSNNNLLLYDYDIWDHSNDPPVCASRNAGNADENMVCTILRTGIHFIAIRLVADSPPNTYHLRVSLVN